MGGHWLRGCIAFLTALAVSLPALAINPSDIDADHRSALSRFMQKLGIVEILIDGFRQGTLHTYGFDNPISNEALARINHPELGRRLEARLLPLYADVLTKADAQKMVAFLETSAGQKLSQYWRAKAKNPALKFDEGSLTDDERRTILISFAQTGLGQRMVEIGKRATAPTMATALRAFVEEERLNPMLEAAAYLARRLPQEAKALQSARPDLEPVEPPPDSVLCRHFDRLFNRFRVNNGNYVAAVQASGLAEFLKPENLISPEHVARSRHSLQNLRQVLLRWQSDNTAAMETMLQEMRQLNVSPKLRDEIVKGMERGMTSAYTRLIDFGENQQRILEIVERILVLIETNQGSVAFENGKLVFPNDETVRTFNELTAELGREAKRESEISQSSVDRLHEQVNRLRNIGNDPSSKEGR